MTHSPALAAVPVRRVRPADPDPRGRPAGPDPRGRPAGPDPRGRPADPDPRGRPPGAGLDDLLAAQDGLLTRAQAVRLGLSPDTVDRRLAARRWVPAHPRVYRDLRYPATDATRVRAAVLWAGDGAVLTGAAAAWWWGLLDAAPATVTVTVPRRRAPRSRAGVQVRRRDLPAGTVAVRAGLAVATAPHAALGAALDPHVDGEGLLTAILSGALGGAAPDPAALRAAQDGTAGAHGSAATGRMLAAASRRAGAAARRGLRDLLVRGGLPGWRTDHEVAGVVLGLAFPAVRIAVDVRGAEPDGDGPWRRAVLRRLGWRVLTLEPSEVLARPAATLARLAALLSTGPAGPGGLPARAG